MRILHYNWVDYLDDEGRGGGVTVYIRNLMDGLSGIDGVSAMMLSSGISHDLRPGAPRWQPVRHGPTTDRARRIEILNSGTLSPSHYSFAQQTQIAHAPTEKAFADVLGDTGPYDVVHFHNLEGLPARVLALKERHPETRIVLSWHNYYAVCPQVNLWFQEHAACDDFDEGRKCRDCLLGQPDPRLVRIAHAMAYRLKRMGLRPGSRLFDLAYGNAVKGGKTAARLVRRLRPAAAPDSPRRTQPAGPGQGRTHFAKRRDEMIALINAHVDVVHCVSKRTADIAAAYGVDPSRIAVRYIGSPHARHWDDTAPGRIARSDMAPLRLAFLGYMRPDKGFMFLLDALESMADSDLSRLDLLVAARGRDPKVLARLEALKGRMHGLRLENGYAPDQMTALLSDRDVGIVPNLWEDNLPQVALEMHARHLPLLVSDRGGASELAGHAPMIFRAGDKADFTARLQDLLAGRVDMEAYWAGAMAPRSVSAHLDDMLALYKGEVSPG